VPSLSSPLSALTVVCPLSAAHSVLTVRMIGPAPLGYFSHGLGETRDHGTTILGSLRTDGQLSAGNYLVVAEADEMTYRLFAKNEFRVWKIAGYLLFLCGTSSLLLAEDIGWPREITQNGARIVYYQPQIDQWSDYRTLDARMAVSVTPTGGNPTPGVVSIQARTDVNKDTRTVVVSDMKVLDARFSSADAAGSAKLGELVRTFFKPEDTMTISLDRLAAEVEEGKVSGPAIKVDNKPPKIFVSRGTTVLLLVDNKEVLAPIEKTKLEFVVNANWTVLFGTVGKKYYLLNGKQWLTAAKLEGPWIDVARTQGAQSFDRPAQGATGGPSASQRPAISSGTIQQLDRDAEARQTGTRRTQQFERSRRGQGGGRTRGSGGTAQRRSQ
jgi:hypothetical protein